MEERKKEMNERSAAESMKYNSIELNRMVLGKS